MADVPLAPIRVGFGWSADIDFPAGFLVAGEGVRTKLRRFVGDTAIVPGNSRAGDTITWDLPSETTALMQPGTYYAEAEIYTIATPALPGQILTDNRYMIRCNRSPSE